MTSDVLELPAQVMVVEPRTPASELPEHLLIARLRRKDPAAFEALVKAHQDRVYDFCVRMLADREEAFDLTQEIFISVHKNMEKFRADAKLTTWIYRIARNHCLNRLKYLKRRGRGRSDEYGECRERTIARWCTAPFRSSMKTSAASWCCVTSKGSATKRSWTSPSCLRAR